MKLNLRGDLTTARAEADREIRAQAEVQRLQFITPGSGKAMAYQQKAAEAEQYLNDRYADLHLDQYPHIVGEAASLGIDPQAMAFLILYLRGEWQVASAMIEEIERRQLIELDQARTPAEASRSASIDWTPVKEAIALYHAA